MPRKRLGYLRRAEVDSRPSKGRHRDVVEASDRSEIISRASANREQRLPLSELRRIATTSSSTTCPRDQVKMPVGEGSNVRDRSL